MLPQHKEFVREYMEDPKIRFKSREDCLQRLLQKFNLPPGFISSNRITHTANKMGYFTKNYSKPLNLSYWKLYYQERFDSIILLASIIKSGYKVLYFAESPSYEYSKDTGKRCKRKIASRKRRPREQIATIVAAMDEITLYYKVFKGTMNSIDFVAFVKEVIFVEHSNGNANI